MKKLICKLNSPCRKCPYKLGQIQTPINPCPQCKLNSYQHYEVFQKQLARIPPNASTIKVHYYCYRY